MRHSTEREREREREKEREREREREYTSVFEIGKRASDTEITDTFKGLCKKDTYVDHGNKRKI